MASWEDYVRQNVGAPIQQAVQAPANAADLAADKIRRQREQDARMAALQQAAGSPNLQQQPLPQTPSEVQPNSPTMNQTDAQSRLNAMIQAPASMQQTAAKLKAQADQDAAEEAAFHQNIDDTAGYSDYKPSGGRFQKVKQSLAPSTDEDDEDNKAASGVKQTGTLGGV